MAMLPSEWLFEFLKRYERFRPTAYKPTPNDVFTCGYGHTRDVVETTTCDMPQALEWLHEDSAKAAGAVNHAITVPMTQAQFDAMVSLCFNIGTGAFAESTLVRMFNDGDTHGAAAQFGRWNKQRGRPLDGLTARREDEMDHFL